MAIHTQKEKIDYSGLKFIIAEEMGDPMDVFYFHYQPNSEEMDIYTMNHKYYDGIGSMTAILEEFGYECEFQPTLKISKSPPLLTRIFRLFEFLGLTKPVASKWKKRFDKVGRPEGLVYIYGEAEVLEEINQFSRKNGHSPTALFIWALDNISRRKFQEANSVRKWISPINMRVNGGPKKIYGNNSASMIVNLEGDPKPIEIHDHLKTYFKRGVHWGSWLYTNMAKFIGLKGTRYMALKIKDVGTGVFSNMGDWPLPMYKEGASGPLRGALCAVAPASQVLPVTAVCMNWEGQLGLTLQVHPCLGVDLKDTEVLAREWIEEIRSAGLIIDSTKLRFISLSYLEIEKKAKKLGRAPNKS